MEHRAQRHGSEWNAFTVFLAALNNCDSSDSSVVTGGYAGHCDWPLPQSDELQTILLAPYPCATNPCIDQAVFGPTAASSYYSSATTRGGNPSLSWVMNLSNGFLHGFNKGNPHQVRAVRLGL